MLGFIADIAGKSAEATAHAFVEVAYLPAKVAEAVVDGISEGIDKAETDDE